MLPNKQRQDCLILYCYRIGFHGCQIQIHPLMFYHAVTEHLPENIAPELRQCGVDEQLGIGFAI